MDKPWLKEFDEDVAKWRPRWESLYDEAVQRHYEYPDKPLKDYFNYWAEKHPDKPYLIVNDTKLSYGLCNQLDRRLANSLLEMGV